MSRKRYRADFEPPRTPVAREKALKAAGWTLWCNRAGKEHKLVWLRGGVERAFLGTTFNAAMHASYEGLAESGVLYRRSGT